MNKKLKLTDISQTHNGILEKICPEDFVSLPSPYTEVKKFTDITDTQRERLECNLDSVIALNVPKTINATEKKRYIDLFIAGMQKLLSRENNWTFLQPLLLSLDYCVQCQTCSDACHIYLASGKHDLYRPIYRSEIFRRLIKKYTRHGGKFLSKLKGNNIELNWDVITRLYELSYRCNLCRRCTQACSMGIDNALITREIRKLFSQELGWAPQELHEKGTVLQLTAGSPTGMRPSVAKDNVEFIDSEYSEITGIDIKTPWDKEGADVLLVHSAGDILAYPESIAAFSILFNAAGINWTLSSETMGYDGVNYGLFYDDFQLAKIAARHMLVARKLKVKKLVLGECGHEHKALLAVSDRLLTGKLNIPRESALTFLENIVFSGKIRFDPLKNDFPISLHDPCNIVRNLGIVEPQRRILRYLCPQFREMTPNGVNNYCCGGGGGLALMSQFNFTDWKVNVSGRLKFKQILEVFRDQPGPDINKFVCAPCLNCKLQLRDIFEYYKAEKKSGIICGGLAELIVNAMIDIKKPFINRKE